MKWVLIAALAMISAPGAAQVENPPIVMHGAAGSGTGLICDWAIQATVLETGRRCPGPRDARMEEALAYSVERIEDYARRQSPQGAALMASYRARQIENDARRCDAVALHFYADAASRVSPEQLRRDTDRLLATSPPVEWGTCL